MKIKYMLVMLVCLFAVQTKSFAMPLDQAIQTVEEAKEVEVERANPEMLLRLKEAKRELKEHDLELSNGKCCSKGNPFDSCSSASGKFCSVGPTSGACSFASDNC